MPPLISFTIYHPVRSIMKTYKFTLRFTYGFAEVKISAPYRAMALYQAKFKAEAFLAGEDCTLSFHKYSGPGNLESIELDDQIVFEAYEVMRDYYNHNLLQALENLVDFVDDEGEWSEFPEFVAARLAIKFAKGE